MNTLLAISPSPDFMAELSKWGAEIRIIEINKHKKASPEERQLVYTFGI